MYSIKFEDFRKFLTISFSLPTDFNRFHLDCVTEDQKKEELSQQFVGNDKN